MKSIQVKFLGQTNTKPSRYKAFIKGYSATISSFGIDDSIFEYASQKMAAKELMHKLQWDEELTIVNHGVLPNEDLVFILGRKNK